MIVEKKTMEENKLVQKAGDGSQQVQASVVNINNYYGITEEKAKELFNKLMAIALKDNVLEGEKIANKRLQKFSEMVLPRIQKIEKDFNSFSDPAFQILIKKAQITSACSEREIDNNLLSELIAHRINNKENIKKKTSIEKAVEIVNKIDDDALCGLTMFYIMSKIFYPSKTFDDLFIKLDAFYSKFQYMDLPEGNDWLENLDVLGAIRISALNEFKCFEDYLCDVWEGVVCLGICKKSQIYQDLCEDLKNNFIPNEVLTNNYFIDGYVILPVLYRKNIEHLKLVHYIRNDADSLPQKELIEFNSNQKAILYKIFDNYSKDKQLLEQVKTNFKKKLLSYQNIFKACKWWNNIKTFFSITSIGNAIAQANAKRIDKNLPDID